MRLRWFAASCALVLTLGLRMISAHAVSLADLETTGGTITVGDKIFSDFDVTSFFPAQATGGTPPFTFSSSVEPDTISEIDVAGFTLNPVTQGLIFTVPAPLFQTPGFLADAACIGLQGGICRGASLSLSFDYTVTVLGSDLIESIGMTVQGTMSQPATLSISAAGGNLVFDAPFGFDTFVLSSPVSTFEMTTSMSLSATGGCTAAGFPPVISCTDGSVVVSSFAQGFSQVTPGAVPEPPALLVLTSSIATLGALRRGLRVLSRRRH